MYKRPEHLVNLTSITLIQKPNLLIYHNFAPSENLTDKGRRLQGMLNLRWVRMYNVNGQNTQ